MSTHQIGKHASSVRCYEIKKTPFWPFFMFLACDGYDDAERGKSTGGGINKITKKGTIVLIRDQRPGEEG